MAIVKPIRYSLPERGTKHTVLGHGGGRSKQGTTTLFDDLPTYHIGIGAEVMTVGSNGELVFSALHQHALLTAQLRELQH